MSRPSIFKFILLIAAFFLDFKNGFSCSTYKVTVGNKTMYGINYDAWFTQPRIWFETKGFGAVFTGANYQNRNDLTPQSGMNEFGLSFGTLATPTPENGNTSPNLKRISSRSQYLKDILHSCKTVEEVKTYIAQYDHSSLLNDVFIYTDKSGQYLIVEPYIMTLGNESKYVLANFCPSTIKDLSTIKQQRYINGTEFLKNKIDTSLGFCTALSDTMHVCRQKIGDGTLLTSIMDLNNCIIHLYFYHDYNNVIHFNLKEELTKGDHSFEIPTLFHQNSEYQKLLSFKTPINSKAISFIIWICFGLFCVSFPYFLISYFRTRKIKYANFKLLIAILSFFMAYYMIMLQVHTGIFYLPAPYKNYKFSLLDIASYLPFVILLLIVPILIINRKIFKEDTWKGFTKLLFTTNSFAYMTLIILFSYWRFYSIWN